MEAKVQEEFLNWLHSERNLSSNESKFWKMMNWYKPSIQKTRSNKYHIFKNLSN